MSLIMIVDDHAVVREPLAAALMRFGYETVCAADGVDAERLIREQVPDLILLDVAMPRMDGLTLLKRLRADERTRNVPVMILSARAERSTVVDSVRLGIRGYLLKSQFSLQDLYDKIAAQLGAPAPGSPPESTPESPAASGSPSAGMGADTSTGSGAPDVAGKPAGQGSPDESAPQVAAPPAPVPDAAAGAAAGGEEVALEDEPLPDSFEQLKPIMTRSQIKERIDATEELRAFSPTVAVMLKLTSNPRCTIDQIVRAVGRDHAIALKLLKLANSAAYSRGEPVDSVRNAILRIGLKQLRQAVLNIGVIEHFSAVDLGPYMDIRQFWEHAIGCGLIAAGLAAAAESCDTDSAFTMGLLHDAGRLVLHERFGVDYDRVCRNARHLGMSLERIESRMLLLNHADVMDRLLHTWKFPTSLVNPIVFHHLTAGSIRGQAPRDLAQVATLGLANRYAHALLLGSSGNPMLYPTDDLLALLNLGDDAIEQIVAAAYEQTTDMKIALLNANTAGGWTQVREELMQRCGVPIRPLFVATRPRADALNLFLQQVRDPDEEATPNVAVVHMGNVRERQRLGEMLITAEQNAGVSALPTLVLSNKGHLGLDGRAEANRWIAQDALPIHIHRFIARLREAITSQGTAAAA